MIRNQLLVVFGAALLVVVSALAWGLTRAEQRPEVKTILEAGERRARQR